MNIPAGQVNRILGHYFIYPGIKNMAGRRTAMICEVNHRQKMKRHRYCKCVSVFASTVPFSQLAGHFILPLNTDPVITRSVYLSFGSAASEEQQTVLGVVYLRDVESILNRESVWRERGRGGGAGGLHSTSLKYIFRLPKS